MTNKILKNNNRKKIELIWLIIQIKNSDETNSGMSDSLVECNGKNI